MRNPLSDIIVDIPPSRNTSNFDVVSEMKGQSPWAWRAGFVLRGTSARRNLLLEKGRTFYTSNAGLRELKQEIGKYLKRRMHIDYDYNTEILVTVGGSEAIDIALRAMLNPERRF